MRHVLPPAWKSHAGFGGKKASSCPPHPSGQSIARCFIWGHQQNTLQSHRQRTNHGHHRSAAVRHTPERRNIPENTKKKKRAKRHYSYECEGYAASPTRIAALHCYYTQTDDYLRQKHAPHSSSLRKPHRTTPTRTASFQPPFVTLRLNTQDAHESRKPS